MRHSLAQSVSLRIVIASLFTLIGLVCWRGTVDGEEAAAPPTVRRVAVQPVKIPMQYADVYEQLNRRVRVDFQKASFDTAHQYFEDQLGKPIALDEAEIDRKQIPAELTLTLEQPVTIKSALRLMMNHAGLHDRHIGFSKDGVRLLSATAAAKEYVLQTHDLRSDSTYSTKLREQIILGVRRDTTPDAWGAADGPWIAPGASVFTIDVYHTPDVQAKIAESWNKHHRHPWQGGFVFGRSPNAERTAEELKQRAKTLQAEYPFESLAPRLKYEEGKAAKPAVLSPAAQQRLAERDKQRETMLKTGHAWLNLRRASLVQLHSTEVEKFVAREGFGLTRMPSASPSNLPLPQPPQLALPSAEIDPPHDEPAVLVPQTAADAAVAAVSIPSSDDLTTFHVSSESIFVSPQRLGYAKDVEHVAGFGSHAFDYLPRLADQQYWMNEPTEHWPVRRMELVSLMKHDTPQVYVSDELPRMDKEGKATTRDLGEFESAGLAKLTAGEDVVAHASLNRVEMLGALRASKACMECHSVEHGQLLGAFSYTLVRDPLLKEDELNRR